MGSLVYNIASLTDARYGINIQEVDPPSGVQGAGTNAVAVIGEFPWGPAGVVTLVTSVASFFAQFGPLPFGNLNSYAALKAMMGKSFPGPLYVIRVDAASIAAATRTFQDAGGTPANSVVVTAKHPGASGNSIRVAWAVNAADADARDATVSIGTAYTATYKAVAVVDGGALTVTDPADPYVTFTKSGSATTAPAAVSATALASGSDGTAIAGDYTDAIDLLSDASLRFNTAFVAEAPSGLISAINTGIDTFIDAHDKGVFFLCTPASQTETDAITAVGSLRTDRAVRLWQRVKTVNLFDPNRAEVTVDGNSFAAVATASVAPELSPGGAGGAPYLRAITGLEQGTDPVGLALLNENGIVPFFMSTALEGAILHRAVLTTLVPGKTKVFRRRMTDFITVSLADFLERFLELPLDIDLNARELGPVTGPQMALFREFLESLKRGRRILAYSVDEFGANNQTNLSAGQWIIVVKVTLVPMQEEIVLQAQIGETVTVDEV